MFIIFFNLLPNKASKTHHQINRILDIADLTVGSTLTRSNENGPKLKVNIQ